MSPAANLFKSISFLPALLLLAGHGPAQPATGPVSAVRLTLDVQANAALAQEVRANLAALQAKLRGQLCYSLTKDAPLLQRPEKCHRGPEGHADLDSALAVVQVVVLRESLVHRLVVSHPAQFEQPWAVGSISKTVLAVPILARAGASEKEPWCIESLPGLRNANGSTGDSGCGGPNAQTISAASAIAHSNNLATIWRLRKLAAKEVTAELESAGLKRIPGDYHPGIAIALGMLELSPRQTLECFDALVSGSAKRAAITLYAKAAPSAMARWCEENTKAPAARAFTRAMLQAPGQAGGTANFIRSELKPALLLGSKTGTPTNDETQDTGKSIVFAFALPHGRYSALISIVSPRPSWPLGFNLVTKDLLPLVRAVIRDAQKHDLPSQR